MSSHDATAADRAQAVVVASRREKRAEAVLRRLEAHMAVSRLRGHIYQRSPDRPTLALVASTRRCPAPSCHAEAVARTAAASSARSVTQAST